MKVNRVRQQAAQYMNYDMIQQHTELPSFPDYQIQLMLSFLHHDKRSEIYSLVTSLVHVGLDTHELVEAKDRGLSVRHMRSKQMKVLAGDYFSGRYYEILAHAGEIDAIRKLSEAICDVNQMKMNLYMRKLQRDLSGEQYLQQLLAIRTRLFLAFESEIAVEHRPLWRNLLYNGTRIEILQRELALLQSELSAEYEGWAVWEVLGSLAGDDRADYLSSLDKPDQLKMWFDRYHLREDIEVMIERTADEFALFVDGEQDKRIMDAVIPVLENNRNIVIRPYSFTRGGADGSESQGEACTRSV